ncbi:MAG: pantothenate kinase [Deltaproteobacteria bacterium]|nr:MAG: pantothenate kinase [Deltaproteobacteria bacterium]
MLFVVDIGNSHIVTGVYKKNNLLETWRTSSHKNQTSDEIAATYQTLFNLANLEHTGIHHLIISSVVPKLEAVWLDYGRRYLSNSLKEEPFIVDSISVGSMIGIEVEQPAEVGADRLVNAIAAWHKYSGDSIVIDFGTAITFDCISADCKYLGGMILPGIALSMDALSAKAAKLPQIDIGKKPKSIIGKNTVDSMVLGALHGYGAMIDGISRDLKNEMTREGNPFTILATGGMAEIIAPCSAMIDHIEPMLTLEGLKIIHEKKTAGKA